MPTGSPTAAAAAGASTTVATTTTASTSPAITGDSRSDVSAPSTGSSHQPRLSQTNLYIRGLSPDTTDKDLVNLCQP